MLMQKMARDRLKLFAARGHQDDSRESALCARLAQALAPAAGDKAKTAALWDDHWQLVYELAEATMDRTMADFMAD